MAPAAEQSAAEKPAPDKLSPKGASDEPAPDQSSAQASVEIAPAPPQSAPETPLLQKLRQPLARSESRAILLREAQSGDGKALVITLDAPWFELSTAQQDELAATLWDQAQALDFERLRLVDGQGQVIGRSPVVGDGMVLLLR